MTLAEAESIDEELAGFDHGLRHIPSQWAADGPRGLDDLAGVLGVADLTEAFGFDAGAHAKEALELELPDESGRTATPLLNELHHAPFIKNQQVQCRGELPSAIGAMPAVLGQGFPD